MTTRTMNRVKNLQRALYERTEVETLSGRVVRVLAVDFDGAVWVVDVRSGESLRVKPWSFSGMGA